MEACTVQHGRCKEGRRSKVEGTVSTHGGAHAAWHCTARICDQTTFMANKHKYKGLTLLMHPCIEGDLGGEAGGTGFLVRTELLEQELFLDFGSVNTVGFYGPEVISTLKIRTARHYCTWVSMYLRQRHQL